MTSGHAAVLDPSLYREIVRRALAEDLGWGDVTTDATVPGDTRMRATVTAVDACVVAGLAVADEAFHQLDPAVRLGPLLRRDGEACAAGEPVASWEGRAAPLLTAHRTALNFLERLSGIATATRRMVEATGGRARLVATRSTTPTLRALEHYAVEIGGGGRLRGALDGAVVIRGVHVRLAGGIRQALGHVAHLAHELPIEIEVQSGDDAREALAAGATRVLVVQPEPGALTGVLDAAREQLQVHVSGDFTPDQVAGLVRAGVDMISAIGITRHAPWATFRVGFDVMP